ncbi:MAG: hypothetical protein AAF806_31300, partial [Bacteroidota bacterium]
SMMQSVSIAKDVAFFEKELSLKFNSLEYMRYREFWRKKSPPSKPEQERLTLLREGKAKIQILDVIPSDYTPYSLGANFTKTFPDEFVSIGGSVKFDDIQVITSTRTFDLILINHQSFFRDSPKFMDIINTINVNKRHEELIRPTILVTSLYHSFFGGAMDLYDLKLAYQKGFQGYLHLDHRVDRIKSMVKTAVLDKSYFFYPT